MRIWKRLATLTFCAFAVGLFSAQATGTTGEEETWSGMTQGQYPLAVSADGQWRVHYDSTHRLHRVNIADSTREKSLVLPLDATQISVSRTARWVAFSTDNGCFGLVDFGAPGSVSAPSGRWIGSLDQTSGDTPCPTTFDTTYHDRDAIDTYHDRPAIALSSDGRQAVLGGSVGSGPNEGHFQLIDTSSGKTIAEIPTSESALHLQFVDSDRKLLVVQALFGEGDESPGQPSDVRFGLWNLRSGELQNFAHTEAGYLNPENFLWSFSARTGALHTFANVSHPNTDVQYEPFIVSANLKHCAAHFSHVRTAPKDFVAAGAVFAADPSGRWIALAYAASPETSKATPENELVLYELASGRVLKRWKLDEPLGALAVTPDGKTLFASTKGRPTTADQMDEPALMGGGEVRRFDVPSDALNAAPEPDAAWSDEVCSIESEQPGARDIADGKRTLAPNVTLALSNLDSMRSALYPGTDAHSCESRLPRPNWGVTPDGSLWIDRFTRLERIDPANGHVLETVATPRADKRCSISDFDHGGFVSYEGGKVTFQYFDAPAHKRVIASKPTARVVDVMLHSGRVLIEWSPMANGQGDASKNVASIYELANGEVVKWSPASSGYDTVLDALEADDEEGDGFDDLFGASPPAPGTIRWETSYFGSVRAIKQGAQPGEAKTLLWIGLNFKKALPVNASTGSLLSVQSAGSNVGVVQTYNDVALYDAETHRVLAHESTKDASAIDVSTVRVLPKSRRVVTEISGGEKSRLLIAPLP